MGIHQIQLRYDPLADRLLLSVRSHAAELYTAWLTRRMVARLAEPFRRAVARLALPRDGSVPVPEAQAMLDQVARERPLKDADFSKPFEGAQDASHPLGRDPLLPGEIDVRAPPGGGLVIALREPRGRRLELALNDDLATAFMRLLDQALLQADWALPVPPATPAAGEPPPQRLN
ncbi:MAG: hypothetical protein Fur0014_08840 [Rubrivivax sp.]